MSEYNYKSTSLRENLIVDITEFLEKEGFNRDCYTIDGILALVNSISDYYEEGKHLYPEVVLTNDMELFKTMPTHIITIMRDAASVGTFKNALKLCAPLAVDRWVIFIEIKDQEIRFGVLSTEMSETSLSLYRQTQESETFPDGSTFAYIRSLGQKVVEVRGIHNILHIYLNLEPEIDVTNNSIERLSKRIVSDRENHDLESIFLYIEKLLDQSMKAGHGNLIGVVQDDETGIAEIRSNLNDGIYLEDPVDLAELIEQAETQEGKDNSLRLSSYSSIISAMLNHDGITLFTTKGRLIGYHIFIKDNQTDPNLVGGARSRAFEAMKRLNLQACLYKSQDGNIKYHEKE